MRFRASFSAALVLLVLTMSTWAPACDLFCSFARLPFFGYQTGCAAHGAASSAGNETSGVAAAATVDGMAMDHMAMPANSQNITSPTDPQVVMVPTMLSCGHEPCSQTAISVSAKRTVDRVPLGIVSVFASPTTDFTAVLSQISAKSPDETPPKLGPFDPLGTTLRI